MPATDDMIAQLVAATAEGFETLFRSSSSVQGCAPAVRGAWCTARSAAVVRGLLDPPGDVAERAFALDLQHEGLA